MYLHDKIAYKWGGFLSHIELNLEKKTDTVICDHDRTSNSSSVIPVPYNIGLYIQFAEHF